MTAFIWAQTKLEALRPINKNMCVCFPTVIKQGGMVFAPGPRGRWRQCSLRRLAELLPFSVSALARWEVCQCTISPLCSSALWSVISTDDVERYTSVCVCVSSEWISSLGLCFQETWGIHVTDRRTPTLLFSFLRLLPIAPPLSKASWPKQFTEQKSLPNKKKERSTSYVPLPV